MSQSAVSSDSRESFEARLAGVLMLAYTVLTRVGPDALREREAGGYDGNGDVGQAIQDIDGTVAKVVPWAQWLRDPSCDLSPSLGGKLSSLADGLVVSLVAISLSLAGNYNGMLTPENGLPGLDDEEVADWISARVTPETMAMIREVAGITPAS